MLKNHSFLCSSVLKNSQINRCREEKVFDHCNTQNFKQKFRPKKKKKKNLLCVKVGHLKRARPPNVVSLIQAHTLKKNYGGPVHSYTMFTVPQPTAIVDFHLKLSLLLGRLSLAIVSFSFISNLFQHLPYVLVRQMEVNN